MKSLKKSRTVWAGNVLTAVGVVQAAIVAAPAGSLAPGAGFWISVACAVVTVLLGGTVVALRVQDKRRLVTAADLLHRVEAPGRCTENRDGHRCNLREGHGGAHSKPPIGGGK
jgi:hypothetical protein